MLSTTGPDPDQTPGLVRCGSGPGTKTREEEREGRPSTRAGVIIKTHLKGNANRKYGLNMENGNYVYTEYSGGVYPLPSFFVFFNF